MGMFSELKKIEEKKTADKKPAGAPPPPEPSPPLHTHHKTHKTAGEKGKNKAPNITSNITILQLNDKEIDELRDPSNENQTFRLTEKEKVWIKDTAYLLSKEIRRGSVSQTDILRLSFLLFEKLLTANRAEIIGILERIK